MTNPYIIVIDGVPLRLLLQELAAGPHPPATLRVWFDDGGAKFKLDNSTWSPPLGRVDEDVR
jgi:hypothetical protein